MDSCNDCGITSDIIDSESFSCSSDSPMHVTYRARLKGTSEISSTALVSVIEDWVSSGSSVIVTGVRMMLDSECPVAISSLDERECQSPANESSSNNTAIIGGIVAAVIAVLIISTTVVIVVIVVILILRNRRRSLPITNPE